MPDGTEHEHGWVSGRLKESVDGLSGRGQQTRADQRRLRERAEAEAWSADLHGKDAEIRERGSDD